MNLRTFVIANNIKNLTDARYCAGMGVPYIGFNLDKNGLDETTFIAITEWISGCTIVGEFHSSTLDQVQEKISALGLTHVLSSNREVLEGLDKTEIEVIYQPENDSSPLNTPNLAYTIVKEPTSPVSESSKLILGGNINPEDLEDIIANNTIYGIAIEGGDEERPGFKDMDALADILEALEDEY